ncbi:hypothetical protein [Pseudoalteromonas sp. MB47]|uniref:hypothetical protein n=1 Tax=Pseudoalteromonas sp. MB47 TaxID=2588452 RepID=UPI0014077E3A|nr:hypothetical protein [Pseudoalteromonas sp. MB47]NHH89464.1 hypothetical protein [Pseudoalteromonas sp. MB47]
MNTDGITVSMSKGIKANFKLGEHLIEYWGSAYSGKEVLKVDGELIAESCNFKTKSVHKFNIDGKTCQLTVSVTLFRKFSSTITLECEGELVHSYQLTYGKTRQIAWYLKAIPFLFAGVLGWCFAADILTLIELVIFGCLTFAVSELVMKDQGWIIEEQKPCN